MFNKLSQRARPILTYLLQWLPRLPLWLHWSIVWWANQQFLVGVAAVIFNEQGHVLLFKHTCRAPGYAWGLPTGWLKRGEEPQDGIIREIYEESRLHARVIAPVVIHAARRVPRLDLVFLGELCGVGEGFVPSLEVTEASFFPLTALPTLLNDQRAAILLAASMAEKLR